VTAVLVRHGETAWNREGRVQGWAPTSLTDRGREQARTLGAHLASAYDVDRAVCGRCEEPVSIGLLTEAACPHCDAAITDVQPAAGFLGNPRLSVADEPEPDDENLPDASEGA
jgi:hypothetical protein